MSDLTQEEREIVDYVESAEAKSILNVKQEISRYKTFATTQMTKKKAISIRLLESDIESIKAKALSQGIPYQTLLSSLAHLYASGKIKIESA